MCAKGIARASAVTKTGTRASTRAIAKAPGKLVISGAYAVLEGAPAIVTAVDRYAVADTSRRATFEAPEARAAIAHGSLPHVDVSSLRQHGRKLGLGSSAAIVVASLGAVTLADEPQLTNEQLREQVCMRAVVAHREAQGGGSGIDVVTSTFGKTQVCAIVDGELQHNVLTLPDDLCMSVLAANASSSTPRMLSIVRSWATANQSSRIAYAHLIDALTRASRDATRATCAQAFVRAIVAQTRLLAELGRRSGAPIVPDALHALFEQALCDEVAVHPSGAGGGDIVLCIGKRQACDLWTRRLIQNGYEKLTLSINAEGLERVDL